MTRRWGLAALAVLALAAPGAAAGKQYGFVDFPEDEHEHLDGWNFWWGAADLVTESGNRYTVGIAFDSLNGIGLTGQEVFPRQGPYEGRMIASMDGPEEWGHGPQQAGRFPMEASNYVPGVSERLKITTHDANDGLKQIGSWERTSLERESYRFRVDNGAARVHPTGEHVRLLVDLKADMRSPPLLAGGTGQWWYGIPDDHHYPSRSYHYVQGAETLSGTLELEQPDGSILRERVVPSESSMVMIREYDATPEDLPGGLALAEATQIHPRYVQYYEGGMPWELIFLDLKNGAQLMVAVLAFHETDKGTATPFTGPDQATYKLLATLRLPNGKSVALDDALRVEHLSYKTHVGRVPTFWVAVKGIWTMAWEYRISFPGGRVAGPDGKPVEVPSFDLGVTPQFGIDEPAVDERGNGPTQRIPFEARGSYDGCPVEGFGWSELIIQWRAREEQDPWWTGGELPPVPGSCGGASSSPPSGTPGELTPPPEKQPPPDISPEGCTAFAPGPTPICEYEATTPGGLGGFGAGPGGWRVEITRPGESEPTVIGSFGGYELYACGTIEPGDHVEATAADGSGIFAGNPGICF